MATIKLGAYGATVTVLSTELNSLANNNVSAASTTVLDNTTNLNLYIDVELIVTFGTAPTAGNVLSLYMETSLDGTNYEVLPGAGTALPQSGSSKLVGNFVLQTAGTAQRLHLWRIPLVPGKHKFQLVNSSGVAFPASGSTVVAYPYSLQSV